MYKTVGSDSSPQVCLNSHSVGEQNDEGKLGILSHKSITETETVMEIGEWHCRLSGFF